MYKGKVLSIAGSDPSGGAGIQADIKTITMLGCYAACCITALTAQNTTGVSDAWDMAPEVVEKQVISVLSDIKIDAIKIGMLPISIVETVTQIIPEEIPIIFDPVMVSTSGFHLVTHENFVSNFAPLARKVELITPNIVEASIMCGKKDINSPSDMVDAAKMMVETLQVKAVLVTGNVSNEGEYIENVLLTPEGIFHYKNKRVPEIIHGTGCTLSAAIASFVAQGLRIEKSVELALDYMSQVVENIPKVGQGFNPVFHNYSLARSSKFIPTQEKL